MLKEDTQYFNRRLSEIIDQRMEWTNKILVEVINYVKETGGKRIRPLICLLSAEAVGGSRESAINAAIAIELIHNASLVHDDIIDGNYMRRKKPSKFAMYGEKKTIIIGDFLFGLFCEMLAKCGAPEVVRLISKVVSDISMGQYLEFTLRNGDKVTEQYYREVVELKTASLFRASAEAGALLGGGEEREIEKLRGYGKNLGIAFQLQDDILDICGDPENIGKPVGLDLKNGEKTILFIHALNNAKPSEEMYLKDILSGRREISNGDINKVKKIFMNSGSIEYAIQLSNDIIRDTKNYIEGLKESEAKKKLLFIADLTSERIKHL